MSVRWWSAWVGRSLSVIAMSVVVLLFIRLDALERLKQIEMQTPARQQQPGQWPGPRPSLPACGGATTTLVRRPPCSLRWILELPNAVDGNIPQP